MEGVPCPECGGDDAKVAACKACDGGELTIKCCPMSLVEADAFELAAAADLAKLGHWYRGKGWGNEVSIYVDAVRALWGFENEIRAAMALKAAKAAGR